MADVTVNTAVGKQSQQMEGRIVLLYVIYGPVQSLIFKKAVVFYGFSDSGQFLIDDSPGADIEMSDFRVAHLPIRQADGRSAGSETRSGILGKNFVQIRLLRLSDGIALLAAAQPEAVENHQHGRFFVVVINSSLRFAFYLFIIAKILI